MLEILQFDISIKTHPSRKSFTALGLKYQEDIIYVTSGGKIVRLTIDPYIAHINGKAGIN